MHCSPAADKMALNSRFHRVAAVLLMLVAAVASASSKRPLVLGHRGSCGVLPEHTVASYERAVTDGADVIECDVTLSRDLVPVCLHEELLQKTTDVAERPEFASRKRSVTVTVDGQQVGLYLHSIVSFIQSYNYGNY